MEGKGLDIPRDDQQGRTFHSTVFPHPQPSVASGPQTLPSPSPSPHFYRQNLSWARLLWAATAKEEESEPQGLRQDPPVATRDVTGLGSPAAPPETPVLFL